MISARAVGLGFAAVCALLLGLAQPASAGTKLRGAREISGLWVQYPFGLTFDPSVKYGALQKVVLKPEYDQRYKARLAALAKGEAEGEPLATASTLCLPSGMPGTMLGFAPLDIVATKKTVYVFADGWDPPRRIFMDGRSIPSLVDLEPSFAGYSVGRWEGNTLVVDTAGVKTRTTIDNVPHSDALRINERIRLLDDDTLEILFTMTDPNVFMAPWIVTRQYKAYDMRGPGGLGGPGGGPRAPGGLIADTKEHGTYPDYKGAELAPTEIVCNENNRNPVDENGVVTLKLGDE
jgi:hypothetical protein